MNKKKLLPDILFILLIFFLLFFLRVTDDHISFQLKSILLGSTMNKINFTSQMEIYCWALAPNLATLRSIFHNSSFLGVGLHDITWIYNTQYTYHANDLFICRCTNMWAICYTFETSRYAWHVILGCFVRQYWFR